jgi:hypothetical protein
MAVSPEVEPQKKDVEVRPDQMEIPPEVERATGVRPTQTQVTTQVTDDQGQPIIQTPQVKPVTIQTPADLAQLAAWAKGSPKESLTWFATFWLRLIKKALHFGWKVVGGGKK